MSSTQHDITLYTAATPNGTKVSILLEELGLPYNVYTVNMKAGEQKEPWFLKINPNGRIPAISDKRTGVNVFESGSILTYLVETYDKERKLSYEHGSKEYWEVMQWVFFQNAGVGPMQGQLNHFYRYATEKIPYAVKRYSDETRRLYGVLESQLKRQEESRQSPYLVGEKLTIADITTYGWVRSAAWAGVEVDEFPRLKRWEEVTLGEREAVKRGQDVPAKSDLKALAKDPDAARERVEENRGWILEGGGKKA